MNTPTELETRSNHDQVRCGSDENALGKYYMPLMTLAVVNTIQNLRTYAPPTALAWRRLPHPLRLRRFCRSKLARAQPWERAKQTPRGLSRSILQTASILHLSKSHRINSTNLMPNPFRGASGSSEHNRLRSSFEISDDPQRW